MGGRDNREGIGEAKDPDSLVEDPVEDGGACSHWPNLCSKGQSLDARSLERLRLWACTLLAW